MPPQTEDESATASAARDPSIEFGRLLAHPEPGDEVVVSGVAGNFPDADGVHELRDGLFAKADLVTGGNLRWDTGHPEIPQRTGKVKHAERFDAGFFGIHHRQVTSMDPMNRLLLERAMECILDAGINPSDLEGTNTGVFVGACFSESEKTWFFEQLEPQMYGVTGCERSMIPNRISYFLKLEGPSLTCDTACSSSLYALEHAYRAIRLGQCDQAIVGGTNMCLHAFTSLQFFRLGVLSRDGKCKVFDAEGNGYARSETVAAIFLQKSKVAKRIYTTILHAKTNCDGYKDSGITYPSGDMQLRLLREFYEECDVNPADLTFLEAHGTGTKVGDPEECQSIENIFLENRKLPLLIGSVKSNIGHTEPSSGLCSITKAIIAMESGYIPPNINYTSPRKGIKALEDGRMVVVTEKTRLPDNKGLIGINNFGFGGGNCHVLLKWNTKEKIDKGLTSDDLPRLVCVSGRTQEAVYSLLDDVLENKCDVEHIRLFHEIFGKNINKYDFRGYSIVTKSKEIARSVTVLEKKAPLYIAFSEFTNADVANTFSKNTTFDNTIKRIQEILSQKKINVYDIIHCKKTEIVLYKLMATVIIQIGLIEILKELEVKSTDVFGLFLSQIVSLYWNNDISLREAIECAYIISLEVKDISHSSWILVITNNSEKVRKTLPENVDFIGNVSKNSVIISIPAECITNFTHFLQRNDITYYNLGSLFYFKNEAFLANKSITQRLSEVVTSSLKPNRNALNGDFGNGLFSVLPIFKFLQNIPKEGILLEIGDGIFRSITKGMTNKFKYIQTKDFNSLIFTLGRLYELGHNPKLHKLYPQLHFPVSRGTPMISPKIKWYHHEKWWVCKYAAEQCAIGEKFSIIRLSDRANSFLGGHLIDGRLLFPATGYLQLVWETLAQIKGSTTSDMQVVFEDCKFKRACSIPEISNLELIVMVQRGSGNFEVIEDDFPVVTGRVYKVNNMQETKARLPLPYKVPEDIARPLQANDIYKELRLRGYDYKGMFKSVMSCDSSCQVGTIMWNKNLVTFMDNMLQLKILQEDTRLLYVPTSIKRLSIDAKRHYCYAETFGNDPSLPVYSFKDINVIWSGGIEISGLTASSVARRKYLATPVLEKYVFVPNVCRVSKKQSVRINTQIALESAYGIKVKAVELIDEATATDSEPLAPLLRQVLEDQPLIQPDIKVLSKQRLEIPSIKVEDKRLLTETECMLVVASKLLERPQVFKIAVSALKDGGFIISRESLDFKQTLLPDTDILTVHEIQNEKLVFMRRKHVPSSRTVVNVSTSEKGFTWLSTLQNAIKSDLTVLAYSQNDPLSGILGLVNCMRREPGGQNVRCVFIDDEAPNFDPEHPFYREQLEKDMAVNIFKDGQWGTYRHLSLDGCEEVEAEHFYVNSLSRGDLSSLKWIEGPLRHDLMLKPETSLIHVYYAALNFRDLMTSSGRINVDAVTRDRREQECVQGLEYSGVTADGRRVMGLALNGAMSTLVLADSYVIVDIPESWSLEDAATVPAVYCTSLYALFKIGRAKRGDTILIHSGTGGVGQAAISLALHFGCEVFTTVGTPEKKDLIKKIFPQLSDKNIANSRDTTFEQHIARETNGRGVDIVLNSLAEDKLLASVRCLTRGGRFVEIGKYDLSQNNALNLLLLRKEASFHGFMLDWLLKEKPLTKIELVHMLIDAIRQGAVKPLQRKVFKMDDVESAFRYMGTGKHTGKVLIQIRQEESGQSLFPRPTVFKGMPRYYCDEEKTYIIFGGLGGFGLELADWLVLRGARNLVLTSRTGIKTGYQQYRKGIWESYGCTIQTSTKDITTKEGCRDLILDANKLGPVHAVFNLAVVLKDGIFENQSDESFEISFGPKARVTQYLDETTRELCPALRDFVVFSSVSCGRGNAGQTNYGMANSVMERICERRRAEGYPALAVQWGAVGDVGLVAEMLEEHLELEIGGTLQQRITSCLSVMDTFLRQTGATVVSSMVVAEKRGGTGDANNIVEAVANILGVKDLKSVSMNATLAEIGMDSMSGIEVKQTLEREFEVFLTAQDIKSMTFSKLRDIQAEQTFDKGKKAALVEINMLFNRLGEEATSDVPIMKLENRRDSKLATNVIIFPGIDGVSSYMEPLASNLEGQIFGLQFCNKDQGDTIEDMALAALPHVEKHLSQSQPFTIIGHSFGGVVGLHVVHLLEEKGYRGTFICIDGALATMQALLKILDIDSEDKFQTTLVMRIMSMFISYDVIKENTGALLKCNTLHERIALVQEIVGHAPNHTSEFVRDSIVAMYKRLKALVAYTPNFRILSKVKLFKARYSSIDLEEEDHRLSDLCENVETAVFEGDHVTILENIETADAINSYLKS